jgi:outer membrane lipopolysaccharide assembly protein LptE/RlpB
MKSLKRLISAAWLVLLSLVSCGYQFEGGGYIHDDVSRVAVRVFENKSTETGAGIRFTNALIREIIQKTDTKIVDESTATAILEGSITAVTFSELSRSTTESVVERRVSATVDLRLINAEGDVIWSVKDFSTNDDYTVSQDKLTDETNKREAVDKIALRSAEKLITKMLTNF